MLWRLWIFCIGETDSLWFQRTTYLKQSRLCGMNQWIDFWVIVIDFIMTLKQCPGFGAAGPHSFGSKTRNTQKCLIIFGLLQGTKKTISRCLSAPPVLDLSLYVKTFSHTVLNLMASGTKLMFRMKYSHIFELWNNKNASHRSYHLFSLHTSKACRDLEHRTIS